MDVASLVISFIGIITIVATIVGGTFAYFGFATVKDISEKYERLTEKNNKVVESAKDAAEKFSQAQIKFENDQAKLLEHIQMTSSKLNGQVVQELVARFRRVMEDITLDELDKTPDLTNEIGGFTKILADLGPVPAVNEAAARNIKLLVEGLENFIGHRYEDCIDVIKNVADDDLNKHRILTTAYSRLYERARKNDVPGDQVKYANLQIASAQKYSDIVKSSSRSSAIALVNLATGLIARNGPGDLDKALEYLRDAQKKEPQKSLIYYNIAVVFAVKHMFAVALDNLELAKLYGDFGTPADIVFFNDDPFFAELRGTDVAAEQERLSKLRSISK
jgi:tetratricopeptide (TPR) repeat protein